MEEFYSKKEFRFIIYFHIALSIVTFLVLVSVAGLAGGFSSSEYLQLSLIFLFFLNPVIIAYLQQKKSPRFGYLLLINLITWLIILIMLSYSIVKEINAEPVRRELSGGVSYEAPKQSVSGIIFSTVVSPAFLFPLMVFIVNIIMFVKMLKYNRKIASS